MNSATHIAAQPICINGRVIQRCAVCGYKLLDSLNKATPMSPEGHREPYPHWPFDEQIRVHEGNPEHTEVLPRSEEVPDDCCIALVEEGL